ncbi:hypothetical protein AAY53_02195 [Vibrio metoecus]|nr:hypothetical protein [Vibrio cholerae]KQA28053.1 hypothetical protein AAY53_02195 [Vibrio metoecus]
MIPNITNSGTMPISGGHAGHSSASSTNKSGQQVGSINMGGGVSPLLIGVVIVALAYLMLRKK